MDPAIDQTLVRGPQAIRIEGTRQILILQKETREVVANQEEVVHGSTKLTYEHGRDVVVGDSDESPVNGYQEIFLTGQSEETYLGTHEGRRPGMQLPPMPTEQEIRKGDEPFDYRKWVGDYAYWLIAKQPERQRELFLGLGGMTTLFLPPDPKTVAPKMPFTPALRAAHPAFQRFDVDAAHQALYAMGDAF